MKTHKPGSRRETGREESRSTKSLGVGALPRPRIYEPSGRDDRLAWEADDDERVEMKEDGVEVNSEANMKNILAIVIFIVTIVGLTAVIAGFQLGGVETRLTAKIDSVETKFDNKFNNLASMMIVAHTNGEATAEELAAIWGKIGDE